MSAVQPSTHPFTCNTCQVAFRSSELQRTHMQSDWHRYNLKRRVASLPPLSSEIFAEKVLANKASAAATAARASFEKSCADCQKTYYSENAYQNHLASQRHRASAARRQKPAAVGDDETASVMSSTFSLGEPIDTAPTAAVDGEAEAEFSKVVDKIKDASLEDQEPVSRRPSRPHHSGMEDRPEHPLSPTTTQTSSSENTATKTAEPLLTCLFCNFLSPSSELNLMHMSKQHGMFIPERDYLVNLEGLIHYLHDKIHEGHQCLYCGKYARSAFGAQTHMRDAGHCMIAFSTEEEQLEIGDFYDFRSTYSDDETDSTDTEHGTLTGGVKLGARRTEQVAVEGADEATDDDDAANPDDAGWETDSTLSSVPTDEITSVPIDDRSHMYARLDRHRHHSHSDPRPHRAADGWHSHAHATPHAVYHDDFELHLPSGRTAGHRSMAKYFRQNLRNYPTPAERAEMRAIAEASLAEAEGEGDEEEGGAQDSREGRQDGRGRQLVSRANGGLGMVGVAEAKRREVRAVEKRERRREQRVQARYQWGNEKRANFQKHYRDPLLQ